MFQKPLREGDFFRSSFEGGLLPRMVCVNQLVSFTIVRAEGIPFRLCRRPGSCLNRQNPQVYHAEEVERQRVPQGHRFDLHQPADAKLPQVSIAAVGVRKLRDRRPQAVELLVFQFRHACAKVRVLVRITF